MSFTVENLEKNMAKLTITVSADDFEKALQESYMKNKNKISVPGFRKGKVPRAMIEKMYGAGIFYEDAANYAIPSAYSDAAAECGLDIVSQPEIDITQVEKGKDFIFTATVAVKPEVTLGKYLGVEIEKVDTKVTADDVKAELEKVREQNSRLLDVTTRGVKDKDQAIIDFEGFVDGEAFEGGKAEHFSLEIGSGQFIPGFEDGMVGHSIDEEFEINVTFPENYNAENLKGKPAVFKCKIHEIKAKEYAELDDEFAKDVSDFDTLDEFKADIRAKLEESAKNAADAKLDADITDAVIEKLEGEIPDAMINNRVDDLVRDWEYRNRYQGITVADYLKFTNTTIEQFKENFKEPAAKQVKLRLALEKIAQIENVAVTDEDVEKEYAEMAENYKMELDKVKALVAEEALRKDLEVEKAFDIVRESADVTEVTE